jgi:hypothetical protein
MIGPQGLFLDFQRSDIERFRFFVPALILIQFREVVQRSGYIRVSGPSVFSRMASARR